VTHSLHSAIGEDHRWIPRPSGDPRPLGVLVVDDEEAVRRIVGLGMLAHGFNVWLAANCRAAVELYRTNHEAIDVVLLDVRMPVSDGPETLAALREFDPHVRFCFMSGDTGKYTEENLFALGAMALFCKPLRLSDLAQKLLRVVPSPLESPDALQVNRWEDDGGRLRVQLHRTPETEKQLQPQTKLQEV
jgi:two-component system OmpR family response regulator